MQLPDQHLFENARVAQHPARMRRGEGEDDDFAVEGGDSVRKKWEEKAGAASRAFRVGEALAKNQRWLTWLRKKRTSSPL